MTNDPRVVTADEHAIEARLLALGGKRAMVDAQDPYLVRLLDHGREFPARGRKWKSGEAHRCHLHVAMGYAAHHAYGYGGLIDIATGYGLAPNARWVRHSWLWDGERVIESNIACSRYYGVILTPFEAGKFVFAEIFGRVPGYREMLTTAVVSGCGLDKLRRTCGHDAA